MTASLSLLGLGRLPDAVRPALDPRQLSVGVVHLGLGAFHRAHQVAFLEDAAERNGETRWAISAFSERSPDAANTLAAQDGLYSLRLASPAGSSLRVLASLRETGFAGDGGIVERLADPDVALVTLTVTEKGYRHDPASGRLRRDDPGVLEDAAALTGALRDSQAGDGSRGSSRATADRPPRTVLGQLVLGLEARRRAGGGGITVASCDNLPANGRLLAGLVDELIELAGSPPGERALRDYLAASVTFPCSMVDRIVPAATADDRQRASETLGVLDAAAVVAEPYRQWVLEDAFAGPRPAALQESGVELVGDVAPYETLKLRVLNASHSALAYLGALAGHSLIAEAVADPPLSSFVRTMVDTEVATSIEPPPGVPLPAYRDLVLERFANPLLAHRCLQVASDGSQKLPQRILATVRLRLAAGAEPRCGMLVVAAWIRAVVEGRDETGSPLALSDPLADELRRRAGSEPTPGQLAERALTLRQVFADDLAGDGRVRRLLAGALADLAGGAVAAVAADYASGAPGPNGPAPAPTPPLSSGPSGSRTVEPRRADS